MNVPIVIPVSGGGPFKELGDMTYSTKNSYGVYVTYPLSGLSGITLPARLFVELEGENAYISSAERDYWACGGFSINNLTTLSWNGGLSMVWKYNSSTLNVLSYSSAYLDVDISGGNLVVGMYNPAGIGNNITVTKAKLYLFNG